VEDEDPHRVSAELVAALTHSGITFPLGVSVGFCDDADN
jgi:hypothetical protein